MIRTAIELARVVVGRPDLPEPKRFPKKAASRFELFRVRLPLPEFRGFYPEWTFAILAPPERPTGPDVINDVISESREIYFSFEDEPENKPILYISDDPSIRLRERAAPNWDDAFCLDSPDFPGTQQLTSTPRQSPIAQAVRNKPHPNRFVLNYSPYSPEKPVESWQFFGREKELDDLITTWGNVILLGGRRIGKTSFMQEARRRIKAKGEEAYYINLQPYRKKNDVINAILREIYPQGAESAVRRGKALGATALETTLKRLTKRHKRTTLLLDEMGNVLTSLSPEDWDFMGVFRQFTQAPDTHLRIIISSFQEILLRMQEQFGGPENNFGRVIRLGIFTQRQAEDIVLSPLKFWHPNAEREQNKIMPPVISKVGFHPFFLQFFCHALVKSIVENPEKALEDNAMIPVRKGLIETFSSPYEEVFHGIPYATLQYLYVRRCKEALASRERLNTAVLDDDWVKRTLEGLGHRSTLKLRRNFLEGLEICGLCTSPSGDRTRQVVAVPIIYYYLLNTLSQANQDADAALEQYLKKYEEDIELESSSWDLNLAQDSGDTLRSRP